MELLNIEYLYYCGLGIISGLIAGLLGLGGGIVIVPALYFLFTWQQLAPDLTMHIAVATSLATIIFTAISSCYAHSKRNAVMWNTVFTFGPGIMLGAIIGAIVADNVSNNHLRIFFGVFEILVAMQIWFQLQPGAKQSLPKNIGLITAGIFIGLFSTILGIGGGTIVVPFLLWCGIDIRKAVGTSSACGLPIAIAGVLSMMWIGWNNPGLPDNSLGYVYLPAAIGITLTSILTAPIGAKLAHKIPKQHLKKIFAVTLLFVGFRILI